VSPRTPALRTATAASFSARNQSAPSVHTNNKVTALSSTPSPTPSTTAAQRSPVALVASNKPAPPITSNQSTSTRAATPSQHSARENARHSDTGNLFGITLLLLLLFALTGGGLWYVLRESHQQVVIPDVTPVAAPITQTPSAPVPAIKSTKAADIQTENKSPTTSATQSEQVRHATSQPAPSNVPVTTTEPAVPQPANKQTTVPDIQSATTNAAKPSASANDYHARIEQDPQGLTIILDAPANDPVFTQAPLAASNDTTASTAVAANNSEMQNAPPVHPQAPERASTAKTESATTPSAAPMSVEIIHIVVKGDTLWAIAKRYVNNPFRYPELARLSKIKNPDLIYPGNRVRIIKRRHQP
jgi:nucleoid-associated protein YgaU